jgi:hypothetical protein
VLDLTSTQAFNGDPIRALALLTEDCHESTSILIDTIMIIWTRIQEGKGMQWKKALLALQIFRDLLLNGPISVVAEAIDGFASIRIMKSYAEAMRGQNSALVRAAAVEVYNLTVNLPVLFAMRRECLNRQRMIKDPKPSPLRKETRMIKGIAQFRNIHIALRPAGATVAPAPPAPAPPTNDLLGQETSSNNAQVTAQSTNYSSDLLSLGFEVTSNESQSNVPNPFDMATMAQSMPAAVNTASNAASVVPTLQQTPTSNVSSQPSTNGETPRASAPTFPQPTYQPVPQQQAQPVATFTQPTYQPMPQQQAQPVANPAQQVLQPMYQQVQHQTNQPMPNQGTIQNSSPPAMMPQQSQAMMPSFANQQPMTASRQPYIMQPQQQPHPMQQQQQWAVQQPSGGFQNPTHPQQFQQGYPQQQQPTQPSKPNFSMFDPMAK